MRLNINGTLFKTAKELKELKEFETVKIFV